MSMKLRGIAIIRTLLLNNCGNFFQSEFILKVVMLLVNLRKLNFIYLQAIKSSSFMFYIQVHIHAVDFGQREVFFNFVFFHFHGTQDWHVELDSNLVIVASHP